MLTNGALYTCTVHAINAEGTGAESVASSPVRAGVLPENRIVPSISGSLTNHHTLTAYDGYWRGQPRPALTRQWQRCTSVGTACVNIAGAVGHTYLIGNADLNHRLRIVVTARNALGSVSVHSAVTARVVNG
jgi:hypothetical protein